MSLYGALFGGVSGLNAQGGKIAIVSDNIANVNTVGYKESEALFETLVLNSTSSVSYQTGGVMAGSRMNVDKQGLLLSTNAATDIAISGQGFFTVNANADGSGQPLYTRAGSFRQDNQGNFVNAAGFYLQGWPLDREGRLPGEPGNANSTSFSDLSSIETVNVESASGVAQATTQISIAANLNAGDNVYPGRGLTTTMDSNNAANFGIAATDIIASAEPFGTVAVAGANGITRGDSFEIVTGLGPVYKYEYGGYTVSREITTPYGTNYGDAMQDNSRVITGADSLADTMFVSDGAGTYTVTLVNHGLVTGDQIVITDSGDTNSLPNGSFTITALSNDTFSFVPTPLVADPGAAASPVGSVVAATTLDFDPFGATGNIFAADSVSDAFFADTTRFSTAALSFKISTSTDTHTFTYTNSSPNTRAGQFNNLLTLAEAIDDVNGLTARVVTDPNGGRRLMIGGEDANEALTFTNGEFPQGIFDEDTTGIDWISELDISNVGTGTRRFSSLAGLEALIDSDDGVTGVIENPLGSATLSIRVDNPLDTINMRDVQEETSFAIDSATDTYEISSPAGVYVGGTDDLEFTITTGVDRTTELAAGDRVVISGETAGLAGLPGVYPNTPGASFAASSYMEVVSVTATSIVLRIPASQYSGTITAPTAAVPASGDAILSIVGQSNQGSLLSELFAGTSDIVADPNINSLAGDPYIATANQVVGGAVSLGPQETGVLGPEYDSSGAVGGNMASGDIDPQFSRTIRVYDALGSGHDLQLGFIKVDQNEWRVELYALDETEVNSSLPDGQLAVGSIVFNGDGSLRSVSDSLANNIEMVWTNGAIASSITIDWGTAGQPFGTSGATSFGDTDGLSQFDSDYTVDYVNQNGSAVGELIGVSIDDDGNVIASYSNGEATALYRLPIADFSNPNGLQAISGNVFAATNASGDVNLREAGTNGVGTVVGASLEQSNVELSEQLTDLIVAQRAYQSNTRVISATDELLEQLNNI